MFGVWDINYFIYDYFVELEQEVKFFMVLVFKKSEF